MQWAEARGQMVQALESCTIPSRADLVDRHEQLADALRVARAGDEEHNRDPLAPAIAEQIRDLEQQIAASEWRFTFRGIGRRPYRRLVAEHPPRPDQVAAAKEAGLVAEFDDETFPPALMAAAAASVTIVATGEQVEGVDWEEIWADWSIGQTTRLWRTCLVANTGVADVPKSAAASAVLASSATS